MLNDQGRTIVGLHTYRWDKYTVLNPVHKYTVHKWSCSLPGTWTSIQVVSDKAQFIHLFSEDSWGDPPVMIEGIEP